MKFSFGQFISLIADVTGKIVDIVTGGTVEGQGASTHGKNRLATQATLTGRDGIYEADVTLVDGNPSLRTFGIQAIESLKGFDQIADTWFYIGSKLDTQGVGANGDVVTVTIAAGDDAIKFPAVSVDTTVQTGDDETDLANRIVLNLNNDADFVTNYFARRIDEDATTVYITARFPGPSGSRPNVSDFQVSATGTTIVTAAWDNIIQRSKVTSLARDPSNPTLGVLGISGSVTAGEGDVTGRIIETFKNNGSDDLQVNGSNTPVSFRVEASAISERFINTIRFEALGNGIQFTNFISKNGALTNGVLLTIRSRDSQITFPAILTTEDFGSFFSRGPSDYDVYDVSGTDYFRATLTFAAPFQLYKQGTFATDDFLEVVIQDNLSTGLTQFKAIAFGFERDF
mgnify:CR=1 FL=1|tara:strand:+ start:110846 stop:112045 length:1200 start_codon:yes stop_codon:yes gene_type:complete